MVKLFEMIEEMVNKPEKHHPAEVSTALRTFMVCRIHPTAEEKDQCVRAFFEGASFIREMTEQERKFMVELARKVKGK